MTTARQIITRSMQVAGILTRGEVPAADEANDALATLNALIDSWSNNSQLIYARATDVLTLVGGQSEYTIGSGQNFNTTRPLDIITAYVRQAPSVDTTVTEITDEAYAAIPDKTVSSVPFWMNYDNNSPTAKIKFYPVPDTAYTFYLVSEKPLTTLALDDTLILPAGWERALVHNLAVELSPVYGVEVPASTAIIAQSSRKAIEMAINKNRTLDAYPQPGISRRALFNGGYYA